VQITLNDASWVVVGQFVFIDQAGGGPGLAGALQVTAKSGNQVTLLNPAPAPAIPAASTSSAGLMNLLSGNTTDFIDGTNHSQALSPVITSVRLRSYNALASANCNFEIDQKLCGTAVTLPANTDTWIGIDRWFMENKNASTGAYTMQQISANVAVPGTSYLITRKILRATLTAAQATLGATDIVEIDVGIEGPFLRELVNDVHSISILCRSSVANLKFGLAIAQLAQGAGNRYILSKLCTLGAANTWTLITLPNLPVFPATGFGLDPGFPPNTGYYLGIQLAQGTSRTTSANDVWVSGAAGTWAAIGISNFSASPVGSTFDLAFVQHEPGPACTTLIDLDFQTNYDRCLRYYCKSYDYGMKPGTSTGSNVGTVSCFTGNSYASWWAYAPFPKPMAIAPTAVAYNMNGTANQLVSGGTTYTVSSIVLNTRALCNLLTSPAAPATSPPPGQFHFTADTGW
jgi:hypothetical protein